MCPRKSCAPTHSPCLLLFLGHGQRTDYLGDVFATVVLLPGHWLRVAGIREHRPKTLKGRQNKHSRLSGSIPDTFRNIEKLTDAGKMQLEIEMGGVKDKEPIQATV